MSTPVNLAVRDWDYLTPLLLKEVTSSAVEMNVTRVNTLVDDWFQHPEFDGGEMSLSRYSQLKAKGDESLVGVPHFLMRGFRHRCIITRKDSPLTTIEDLAGKRIGLTGWQDSGNTWTRAIFRQADVDMKSIHWFVGRLTEQHPITDRLSGFGVPGWIDNCPDDRPMMDLLEMGELDAVCTPFMPAGFFNQDSAFRSLLPDYRETEKHYAQQYGYVPGIHILVLKKSFVEQHAGIGRDISDAFTDAYTLWMDKRTKYADTTPWVLDDIARMHRDLPKFWNDQGIAPNKRMLEDWCAELFEQGILSAPISIDTLFNLESW